MRVDRSKLPEVGPDPSFTFPSVCKVILPNGLSVWSVEHRKIPVVSCLLLLPGGSAEDPMDQAGVTSLTAALLDEGCGKRSGLELHRLLGRLGTQLNVRVGMDATTLRLTMLRRFSNKALSLLAELVGEPRFELEAFDRLRKLRLDRLAQLREVPAAIADRAFAHVLYRDQPYGHLPFGTESAIRRLNRDDIVARHSQAYRPSEAIVILAGDATHAEFEQMAGEAFGDWKAVDTEGQQSERIPHGESKRASLVVWDRPQAAQSELRIGHVAVARNTPDYFPLLVMNTALGGQFTSRINLNLREAKGYTYGAQSSFDFRREPGPFSVQTSVQTDVTANAIQEVLGELHAVRDGRPLTDSEIVHAKRTLTRGYPQGFETANQIVRGLAQLALHDLPDDHFTQFSPSVTAVQSEDIVRVTQTHLDPLHLSTVVVGDLTVIKDGLQDIGLDAPEKIVLP